MAIRLTEKKEAEINETIRLAVGNWQVSDSVDTTIYHNHWMICRLSELADTIEALETIRAIVTDKTGIKF